MLAIFVMRFAPLRCEIIVPDWIGPKSHVLVGQELDKVDAYAYRSRGISEKGRISYNVSICKKAWHYDDMGLTVET